MRWSDEDVQLMWALKNHGWTTARCAKHFGRSPSSLGAIIRQTYDYMAGEPQRPHVEAEARRIVEAAHG